MHTLASPCSAQVRFKNTFDGMPPVRHTSAGHGAWHTGHRDCVRFRNSSLSFKNEDGLSAGMGDLIQEFNLAPAMQPKKDKPMQITTKKPEKKTLNPTFVAVVR